MNFFPKVKTLKCDVISAAGASTQSCVVRDGKIIPALSAVSFSGGVSVAPEWAYCSKADKRVYLYGSGSLFMTDDKSLYYAIGAVDSEPFAYTAGEGENYGLLTENSRIIRNGIGYKIDEHVGKVRGGVYKNGRIFGVDAADGYKIKWSGAGSVTNWEEGSGWVRVNPSCGSILKLVLSGDSIAVVCTNGIALLNAHGDPETFSLSYPCAHLPEIYANSVQYIGKLYFATADGAYLFNGSGAEKLGFAYAERIKTVKSSAALGNTYFLSGKDEKGEGIVAVYDTATGENYFLACKAEVLAAGDRVYGFGREYACALKKGGKFLFESGEIDLGTAQNKTLTKLEIFADNKLDIEVSNGVNSRIFSGVNGVIRPNLRGKSFKITVCGEGEVARLSLVAEAIYGV